MFDWFLFKMCRLDIFADFILIWIFYWFPNMLILWNKEINCLQRKRLQLIILLCMLHSFIYLFIYLVICQSLNPFTFFLDMACWRPWPGFMGAKLARSILQRRFLRYQVQLYCKLEKANNNLFLAGINQVCIEYVFVRRFSGPLESMDKSWLCLWPGSEKQPRWESSISHVSRSNGQKSRWDSNTGNNAMITLF